MIEVLFGVPKQLSDALANLATLLASNTETRLSKLDQTVSSRGSQTTADAILADTAALDTRLNQTKVDRLVGIKSIQRGVITIANGSTTGTATITAVVTGRTELRMLGARATSTSQVDGLATLTLTNTTTITAQRVGTSNATYVGWELTEYYPEGS